MHRLLLPLCALLHLTPACGGAQTDVDAAQASPPPGQTPEEAVQLCHVTRTDYSFIAEYRCPDGSVPLAGDPRQGAAARLGNMGPGPDGHILDLYEVPCPSGAVRIYVDAYHCPEGVDDEIDLSNLSEPQLQAMAATIRDLETNLSRPNFVQARMELFRWILETPQFTVNVCMNLLDGVIDAEHPAQQLLMSQLALSLGAATLESRVEPADDAAIALSGLLGVIRFYQALLGQEGPGAQHLRMDELVGMRDAGELQAFVLRALAICSQDEQTH